MHIPKIYFYSFSDVHMLYARGQRSHASGATLVDDDWQLHSRELNTKGMCLIHCVITITCSSLTGRNPGQQLCLILRHIKIHA